jgi:hypothetical protein
MPQVVSFLQASWLKFCTFFWFYISLCCECNFTMITCYREERASGYRKEFHLFFVPRKSLLCEKWLKVWHIFPYYNYKLLRQALAIPVVLFTIHTLIFCFLLIIWVLFIYHLCLCLQSGLFLWDFLSKILYAFFYASILHALPIPSSTIWWFDNSIWWRAEIMKLLLMQFS